MFAKLYMVVSTRNKPFNYMFQLVYFTLLLKLENTSNDLETDEP
jgi:hypothetical protein